MIVIKIEMWPKGEKSKAYPLGVMAIANEGGSLSVGNYSFIATDRAGRPWKEGKLEGFPRKRLGAYDLIFRCLRVMIGARNELKK